MTTPNEDTVEYNILIQATLALKNLADLTTAAKSFDQQILATTQQVKSSAQQWGVSFQQAKATLQGIDKEISGTAESSVIFGARGQEAWNSVGVASEKAGKSITRAGEASKKATTGMVGGINLVKLAMHVLATSAIFAVIGAFTKLFSMAITGLREMETATYNLINAERTLSEQGVEITPKGMAETIKNLQTIDPLLSKIQANEVVSRISSLVAPNVGLNAEEIDQLSRSIAVLAVRNKGLGKSFEEVESQVSNAFLSGKVSVGINQLGVKINDQIVKDEALRMGLVKTSEEFDNLTGKMESNIKARAMLSVLAASTNKEQEHLPEYLKTADAQFGIFQARLQDLLTLLGKYFGPLLIQVFDFGAGAIGGWIKILEAAEPIILDIVVKLSGLIEAFKAVLSFSAPTMAGYREGIFAAYQKGADAAIESLKEFADAADTATGDVADTTEVNLEEAAENFEKFQAKLDDIILDFQRKQEELNIELSRKLEDLETEYLRKSIDARTDYEDKVKEINQEAQNSIYAAQESARQESIRAEREYLQDLKRLRQKYLMDLEEALHERDARAVLRLRKEFLAEKKNLAQRKQAEERERNESLKAEIEKIERERQIKLKNEQEDYARKLRDLEIQKQREYEDIMLWRQREDDDLKRRTSQRLTDLMNEYIASGQYTQEYLNQMLAMIQSFAAQAGIAFSGIQSSINMPQTNWSAYNQSSLGLASGGGSSSGLGGGITTSGYFGGTNGLAEGGTFLATRPTKLNVAENRPEIITATPLGRPGRDLGKLFMNNGMGEGEQTVSIRMLLSPELRAEIIGSTLNRVGLTIEQVMRER